MSAGGENTGGEDASGENASGENEGHHVFVGALRADIRLGDVRSLKQKRSVIRPVIAEVRRKFAVSVAETGYADLFRRSEIGIAVVRGDASAVRDVLDSVERLLAERPEIELLGVRRTLHSDSDEIELPGDPEGSDEPGEANSMRERS